MSQISRRSFIKQSAIATGGAISIAATARAQSLTSTQKRASLKKPGDKLRMAVIGSGGRGAGNLSEFYNLGEEIVALCDVDQNQLNNSYNKVKERCGAAKKYTDFRELLASEKDLDVVVVSTPDHMHATAAIAAMKGGSHVYVEKPLVRTVWEGRQFKKIADELGVVSQMGNQGNGSPSHRRRIEVLQSGILGRIDEVHMTTNRPIWPQAINRPAGSDPVSASLNWDLWLGVARERPYKSGVYHPFKWRGWFDFGTGAMGDMACHATSAFFRAFKLAEVLTVECVASTPRFPETYPMATTVKTVYRSDMQAEPITVYWYDGNSLPDPAVCPKVAAIFGNLGGQTIITERAIVRGDSLCWNNEEKFKGFAKDERCSKVEESIPRVQSHHWEFTEAIRGGVKPLSHHDHSVPLTEGVLLGCIAQQVPGELQWDAKAMQFKNNAEANKLIHPFVRDGWSIT